MNSLEKLVKWYEDKLKANKLWWLLLPVIGIVIVVGFVGSYYTFPKKAKKESKKIRKETNEKLIKNIKELEANKVELLKLDLEDEQINKQLRRLDQEILDKIIKQGQLSDEEIEELHNSSHLIDV